MRHPALMLALMAGSFVDGSAIDGMTLHLGDEPWPDDQLEPPPRYRPPPKRRIASLEAQQEKVAAAAAAVEVGPPNREGWRWLKVAGLHVIRLRNPKTIAEWVTRFERAPDPVKAVENYRRHITKKRAADLWRRQVRAAVTEAFPGVRRHTAWSGSEYTYWGDVLLLRVSNHPATPPCRPLVDAVDRKMQPAEVVALVRSRLEVPDVG